MIDISSIKTQLELRQTYLSELVIKYVSDHEGKLTVESFVEVSDVGEKSVDDLLAEMDIARVTSEVAELKKVNAALRRITDNTYGECTDCGEQINPKRLEVNPAAERCVNCQEKFERTHGTESVTPSL